MAQSVVTLLYYFTMRCSLLEAGDVAVTALQRAQTGDNLQRGRRGRSIARRTARLSVAA
jgi:hypothetical protein